MVSRGPTLGTEFLLNLLSKLSTFPGTCAPEQCLCALLCDRRMADTGFCYFPCGCGIIWLLPAGDCACWFLLLQFSNSKTKMQLPPHFTRIIFCADSLFWGLQTLSFCCYAFHGCEAVLLFLPRQPFLWLLLQETNNASCKCFV